MAQRIGLEAVLELSGFKRGMSEYNSGIDSMGGKTSKLAGLMGGAGKAILGVGAAGAVAAAGGIALIVKGLASTIGPASDLEESMNKVAVVFGESSGAIMDWASTAAQAMGMSKQQALEAAGTFGNLFTSMGMAQDAAGDMSTDIVKLAADLGSFNNIPIDVALEKLRAGLVGEVEPLRALGVNINQAAVEAKALEMGLIEAGEEMTAQQAVQARYALILEQTANAQGDFTRTSEGYANQQKILKATFEDIKATIGQAVLPAIAKLSAKFSEWLNSPAVKEGIAKLAEWLGTHLPIAIEAVSNFITTRLIPAVQQVAAWIRNNLVPAIESVVGWIRDNLIPAIQTVVGWFKGEGTSAIGAFAEKISTFLAPAIEFAQSIFQQLVGWVQENWPLIQETISTVMEAIKAVIEFVLGAIQTFWQEHGDMIITVLTNAWEIIKTVIETAITIVQGIIKTVMQIITGDWEGAWETIKTTLVVVWEAIKKVIGLAWENIKTIFKEAYQTIIDVFKGIGEWFMGIGKSIVEGIRSGISNAWDSFVSWVVGLLSGLKTKILQFFGIGSPSKVFAEIGGQLMAGLAAGIGGGLSLPVTAMVGAGAATVGAMTAASAGAATGNVSTTTNNVNVSMSPTISNGMDLAEFQAMTLQTVRQALRGY